MNRIVELENVVKIFNRGTEKVHAIDGISLPIEGGEFLSIIGPSGSGKTTLLNLIGCVDTPTFGVVKIDSIKTSGLKEKELAKIRNKKIGFVFQQFFLLPTLTALENVLLPAVFSHDEKARKKEKRARELLEIVDLAGRADHLPSQLSGGEMQWVAIARPLINNPKILLADEPTGNLDSKSAEVIINIFEELNQDGLTVILVTHNIELVKHSKRCAPLKDGKIRHA